MPRAPKNPAPTYKAGHIGKAIAESRPSVDSGMLLSDLIEVWGGTRKLAIDLKHEFDKAAAGGMTRQRILEMIQRLIIQNTTHEIGKPIDPSDMSDADLLAEATRLMLKAASHVTDPGAGPEEAPEGA